MMPLAAQPTVPSHSAACSVDRLSAAFVPEGLAMAVTPFMYPSSPHRCGGPSHVTLALGGWAGRAASPLWQPRAMSVVVATTEAGVGAVQGRLGDLGAHPVQVVATGGSRRWVVAPVAADTAAAEVVAVLQAEGCLAVARPDGGTRLDGWMEHTRPVTIGERISVCVAWSEHDRSGLPGLI